MIWKSCLQVFGLLVNQNLHIEALFFVCGVGDDVPLCCGDHLCSQLLQRLTETLRTHGPTVRNMQLFALLRQDEERLQGPRSVLYLYGRRRGGQVHPENAGHPNTRPLPIILLGER